MVVPLEHQPHLTRHLVAPTRHQVEDTILTQVIWVPFPDIPFWVLGRL